MTDKLLIEACGTLMRPKQDQGMGHISRPRRDQVLGVVHSLESTRKNEKYDQKSLKSEKYGQSLDF